MIRISPRVRDALLARRPLVGLETAVLTHGLPPPGNRQTADDLEAAVREGGAEPAMVGVVAGTPAVGLEAEELDVLCRSDAVVKGGPTRLAGAVVRGEWAGSTVAGSLVLLDRTGIPVLATGGVGGVHRGLPPDLSGDLGVLAASPAVVVCSGPKSVLDLPATREALEAIGVPVLGYGTDEMPGFHHAASGLAVDVRVEGPREVADLRRAHQALGRTCALLVCVPPPPEVALSREEVDAHLEGALADAAAAGVRGGAVTPFLLRALDERSGGRALRANLALLRRNARVGAEIAVAIAREER